MSAFSTTHWSLLIAARSDDVHASAALAGLCAQYRAPVLAFMRRAAHSAAEGDDLTQAFFVHFLEKRGDFAADPVRGKFRQLVLVQMRHFLSDYYAAATALKRGGAREAANPTELHQLPDPALQPEQEFDRSFALTVIARALARMRPQISSPDKLLIFDSLSPVLFEPRDPGALKVIAQAHAMRVNTLAVILKRLRDRLAILIRDEISQLVIDPASIDIEVRALRAALRAM